MKLMLIDGNSIINRAFYGIKQQLTNSEGTPTNAVYGFLSTLFKLKKDEAPDKIIVCFDVKEKTFRHEQFDTYKATRKPMPEDLAVQLPILKDILKQMDHIILCELPGFEADDLLGTFSRQAEELDTECVVVTGDKDSLQLIGTHTHVLLVTTRMGQTTYNNFDEAAFQEKYGFAPLRLIDLKAIMGDSSDNISGVPGIGEKGAMKLMELFGSLEGIYENVESPNIAKGMREKLKTGEQSARDSYYLATIDRSAPVPFTVDNLPEHMGDETALLDLFKHYGFKKFITELKRSVQQVEVRTPPEHKTVFQTIVKPQEALAAITALDQQRAIVLHPDGDGMLCVLQGETVYIMQNDAYLESLEVLLTAQYHVVLHDAKPVLLQLESRAHKLQASFFDISIAAYLLDPTSANYSIARLSSVYTGQDLQKNETGNGQLTLGIDDARVHAEQLTAEAVELAKLHGVLKDALEAQEMHKLYYEIELPLVSVLADMEQFGCKVDKKQLTQFGEMLKSRLTALEQEIYSDAGETFNINSPKQLGVILFEKLTLPAKKKTKTGYSTNVDVLESLREFHPIIGRILEYRQLSKLSSTYVDSLMKTIHADDGRIHSHFQQTVTATGRLSSTDPNMQNIPVRTELGREMRRMFTAEDENYVLVDADYSQIELRILAHMANDVNMIEAFRAGYDIHAATAAKVYHVALEDVTPQMRSSCKAVNFGIVYGISDFSLAQDIGVSRKDAGVFIENYLATYAGVKKYMDTSKAQGKDRGYAVTLFGRRRALPEIQSSNFNLRSFGERVAMNMPIQGTAADIIKIAMVRVHQRLKADGMRSRLILQVHDELIIESPKDEAEHAKVLLTEEMERVMELSVPLVADAKIGFSWYDTK